MSVLLKNELAKISVTEVGDGRRKVRVTLRAPDLFMPTSTCETHYPLELIQAIADVKGPAYLCDEILRDESPDYVQARLESDLLSYVAPEVFEGKRILDFGCGAGASTMVLARMFPGARIVGVELEERLLRIAELRAEYCGCKNARFHASPGALQIPPELGSFDFVVMSAVYEHMLPNERTALMPAIWALLNPKGILFINETPYRYFPLEKHTTGGLPLINYLPDRAAHLIACRFSRRRLVGRSWEELLRDGIRGGAPREIVGNIGGDAGRVVVLEPTRRGVRDRVDLWYANSMRANPRFAKRLLRHALRFIKALTGVTFVPSLSLALEKR